jgi:hypothetical protein
MKKHRSRVDLLLKGSLLWSDLLLLASRGSAVILSATIPSAAIASAAIAILGAFADFCGLAMV